MTDNDKKMLELAALAANYKTKWCQEWSGGKGCMMRHIGREPEPLCDEWLPWNPFENYGDALELSFKLKINIIYSGSRHYVGMDRGIFDICGEGGIEEICWEIVARAAEIGKKMSCAG